jgi:hypothetical protein
MILSLVAALLAPPLGTAERQQVADSRTALVTVSDPRNRFIVDLGPDDFVITEGGQPREIIDARMADYPVVVLVDAGRAAQESFEDIRKAMSHFVARLGQRPIALGTLNGPPAAYAFEEDRRALSARLDRLAPSADGEPFVLRSAAAAARTLREAAPRFSAIVIVSASPVDAGSDAPDELVASIVESGAVLDVVVNRGTADTPLAGGMEAVRRLSEQTHGLFTPIYSSASFQIALDHLADRLASEMMIEYIVPPRAAATDIQIGVRIPGARARGLGVRPR